MSIQQMLLGASGASGYNIDRSLRFRASASAYLQRAPASAGNLQKMTWSFWVKRGALSSSNGYFLTGISQDGSNYSFIGFNNDNFFVFDRQSGANSINLQTTQVFRDPSAWCNIVVSIDTTQATAANRVLVYVNGVQITSFSTAAYPTQNYNTFFNRTNQTFVGKGDNAPGTPFYFDGYLADVYFVDGQALTPASFGETNALTGVWQPKAYTGTYGTNGFYLDFETTTSVAALGNDKSGNGNTWTVNNISLTAGVTYDSMTDVPTLTSASAANFAVLNPLQAYPGFCKEGNLAGNVAGVNSSALATIGVNSGKYYWEVVANSACWLGIAQGTFNAQVATYIGSTADSWGYFIGGTKYNNATATSYGAAYAVNDIIGFALDMDAGTLTCYKNNVSQGVMVSGLSGNWFPAIGANDVNTLRINFGQRPFAYTPPTGFVALNTFNLPTATILDGSKQMDAGLYTGDGTLSRTLTGLYEFQPDFIWAKNRSGAFAHVLQDSVRGFSSTRKLSSNTTDPENSSGNATDPGFGYISGVSSTGFSVASTGGGITHLNQDTAPYVGWAWKANGAGSSNTNGTITSTVSVNATAGFSVVTYTGNASVATVGHGLGVAPKLIIVKARSAAYNWNTYSASLAANQFLRLNTTDGVQASNDIWNSTRPTSSVFSLGNAVGVNGSGDTHVAYCWSEIDGFSKFGSYTGNGSADGVFVYLGFKPKFVLIKSSSLAQNWTIYDTSRSPYNAASLLLFPMSSNAEILDTGQSIDLVSNGFKIRNSNANENTNGATYIYMAFAESPFRNSLAQ